MGVDVPGTPEYRYSKLTAAIDDKHSPFRLYLDETFPHRRLITTPHSRSSPLIQVPGVAGVNPGTLGTAFDVLIGLRYQPNTIPAAARPYGRERGDLVDVWANLLNHVAADDTLIGAAAWAYALAIEAFRSPVMPYDLDDLIYEHGGFNEADLLGIANADATDQLAALEDLARTNLHPHLGSPPPPGTSRDPGWRRVVAWTTPTRKPEEARQDFGPTFKASQLCAADADLIHNGTLYDFKTRLGTNRNPNKRVDALRLKDLYQLVGYALFDTDDHYEIQNVAIYSARYARLTTWSLDDLLSTLAGRSVDVAEERLRVWELLGQGHPS